MSDTSASSVFDLILMAWRRRGILLASTLVAAAIGVGLALNMRPVYRSEVLLSPVKEDSGLSALGGLTGQLGGLAALTGVSIGSDRMKAEAIAVLRSRALAQEFIADNNLIPVLFDPALGHKAGGLTAPARQPTMGDALKLFGEQILDVREDTKTGLVTLRIDWHDRNLAAQWANDLVRRANERMRKTAITEADQSIVYLNREISRTQSVELISAINRLIEAQIKRKTLAIVQPQFAFKVIDPALPADADKRVRPKRTLIVLSFALAGLLLGALWALWLDYLREARVRVAGAHDDAG